MTEEKIKLREHIQKVKNSKIENNLTSKEVVEMYHFNEKYDELTRLMRSSNRSMKEIKESIGTSVSNWNVKFKGNYSKLSELNILDLAECMDLSPFHLGRVIERDIEKQTK